MTENNIMMPGGEPPDRPRDMRPPPDSAPGSPRAEGASELPPIFDTSRLTESHTDPGQAEGPTREAVNRMQPPARGATSGGEAPQFMEELMKLSASPEADIMRKSAMIESFKNLSSADEFLATGKAAGVPPGEIEDLARASGKSEEFIKELAARRNELLPPESELDGPPTEEQERPLTEAEQALGDVKALLARKEAGEDVSKDADILDDKIRGRFGSWLDKNPGKMHRVNKLLVRPGVVTLIVVIISYLALIHAVTKKTTVRGGH